MGASLEKKQDLYLFGYLFKRKNIYNFSLINLKKILHNLFFEKLIIKSAINNLSHKKIIMFDSSVGDWKCQTRTSIIVDLMENIESINQDKLKTIKTIHLIKNSITNFLKQINCLNSAECQQFSKEKLNNNCLIKLLNNYKLLHSFPNSIIFLSLSFLITQKDKNLPIHFQYEITTNKFKEIINKSKATLCQISINYEHTIAKTYGTIDEQKLLQQIESKAMQQMTSLFAGFKPIFKKMKALNQPFLTTTTIFCQCGGVQTNRNDFYTLKKDTYTKTTLPKNLEQVVTIVEVYQYPGSLADLQHKLNIEPKATDIPHAFRKPCTCKNSSTEIPVESFDQAIMAFFAQHPQFTNGAEIDWQGLGLENSDLKKEFDHLRTLQGFSRGNMSIFHINHMYASTIADVLKEQEEIEARLQAK